MIIYTLLKSIEMGYAGNWFLVNRSLTYAEKKE